MTAASSSQADQQEPAAPAPEPEQAPASEEPTSGAELNDLGFALINEGRYEEAIPLLQRAVDSFEGGTEDVTYAYALFNLGHALRLAGRPEEAIPILEQRLEYPEPARDRHARAGRRRTPRRARTPARGRRRTGRRSGTPTATTGGGEDGD